MCELLWIKNVLQDLGIDYEKSMSLYCEYRGMAHGMCASLPRHIRKGVSSNGSDTKLKNDQMIHFIYLKGINKSTCDYFWMVNQSNQSS